MKKKEIPAKDSSDESGKKRGRPVKYPMPERIPDTAENIARALF